MAVTDEECPSQQCIALSSGDQNELLTECLTPEDMQSDSFPSLISKQMGSVFGMTLKLPMHVLPGT